MAHWRDWFVRNTQGPHITHMRNFPHLLLSVVFGISALAGVERPNVLFIIADDLNTDVGCYGAPVHTPGIDALARRGVRFEHSYCQYPLCNPSRSSFLSGLRPDRTQVPDNAKVVRQLVPNLVTLPQAFRQAGYRSVRIGKLFHYGVPSDIGTNGLDDAESWDAVITPKGKDKAVEGQVVTLEPGKYGGTLSWLAVDAPDAEFTDGIAADAAVAQLEKLKGQPFFLAVGFYRPHTPYVAPKYWFDRYPLEQIALSAIRVIADNPANVPRAALVGSKVEQASMTDDQRRAAIQGYRAATSHMDMQVGKVLAALERLDLAKNTIVVFTSDHGYQLGEHGLWQKQSAFERALRVPLIIAGPGVSDGGKTCARLAELVDLFPTLTDLCGVPAPPTLSGVSLKPQLTDVSAPGRVSAFSMVRKGRSLRTERWRYTEWNGGAAGVELYDHAADPDELKNLAEDPALAATVAELKAQLAREAGR